MKVAHNNNFNALRLCAALLVFFSHSFKISFTPDIMIFPYDSIVGIDLGAFGVTIFFIISGFLVTQSWLNSKKVDSFLLNRAVRIYPALLVFIIIKAATLMLVQLPETTAQSTISASKTGIQATSVNYLTKESFYKSFSKEIPRTLRNITFLGIPDGFSMLNNAPLWTLPYEILCYFILCLLCFFINPRKSIPLFTLLYCVLFYDKIFLPDVLERGIFNFVNLSYLYGAAFCVGACFCVYREKIQLRKDFALFAFITLVLLSQYNIKFYPAYILFVAYLVLYIAFAERKFIFNFSKNIDVSYGVYIYSAPIQAVCALYFKNVEIPLNGLYSIAFILFSLLFTVSFAYSSWSLIEKPALKLKKFWAITK